MMGDNLIDPFSSHPFDSMRGIGLIRLFRKRYGSLPIIDLSVCPGHAAIRLQITKNSGVLLTIIFDLVPIQYAMFKPTHKDLVHFDAMIHSEKNSFLESWGSTIPFMLTKFQTSLLHECFLDRSMSVTPITRRFMQVREDGAATVWMFTEGVWQGMHDFKIFEPDATYFKTPHFSVANSMIFWATQHKVGVEEKSIVKARPITFETQATFETSVVLGCEVELVEALHIRSILCSGFVTVFLIQSAVSAKMEVCFSNRKGTVSMTRMSTPWTLKQPISTFKAIRAMVCSTNEEVDLFFALSGCYLFVVEWHSRTLHTFTESRRHAKTRLSLTPKDDDVCHDFATTASLGFILVSFQIEIFDLKTGSLLHTVPQPYEASAHRLLPSFNPRNVMIVSSMVTLSFVKVPPSSLSAPPSLLDQMNRLDLQVTHNALPKPFHLPSRLAPAIAVRYAEQSHSPPASLIENCVGLERRPDIQTSGQRPTTTTMSETCRAVLSTHQRVLADPEQHGPKETLLGDVVPFLEQTQRAVKHDLPNEALLSPDFLLALRGDRGDRFEVTCRLLYDRHPHLLSTYVKTVYESKVAAHTVPRFSDRALAALPSRTSCLTRTVARADIMCLSGDFEVALSCLSTWESCMEFLDGWVSPEGLHFVFDALLVRCLAEEGNRLDELLLRKPSSFDRPSIINVVRRADAHRQVGVSKDLLARLLTA